MCSVLQLILLVPDSAGKIFNVKNVGILPKAGPTESIPSV